MTYIKKIIRRLKYRLNAFLYRFESRQHTLFIYENNDEEEALKKQAEETEALQEMGVIKKFDYRVRKDSESMSDKEKMDKGFDGKTYSKNGLDWDF